jgi:hypothetical protein
MVESWMETGKGHLSAPPPAVERRSSRSHSRPSVAIALAIAIAVRKARHGHRRVGMIVMIVSVAHPHVI